MKSPHSGAAWARIAILAACAFAMLAGAFDATAARRAHLIGVVLPRDARPGDRISASVVTDPAPYEDVPGLRVVPIDTGASLALTELQIDLGDGRSQPAAGPLVVVVPRDGGKIPVSVQNSGRTIAEKQVTLAPGGLTPSRASRDFTMPSVCAVDRVQAIHGPFGGDSTQTSIDVASSRARVLAESPRGAYFEVPDDVSPGTQQVKVREARKSVSFAVQMVGVQLAADKLTLHAGEDTDFTARVSGLKPEQGRLRAGSPSDLYDSANAPSGVVAPAANEQGKLVLEIQNLSPEIVTMTDAAGGAVVKDLYPQDFSDGSYVYHGHLHADQAGTFNLSAEVIPFVADQVGKQEGPVLAENTPETPRVERTPHAEKTPKVHRTPTAHRTEQVPQEDHTPVEEEHEYGPVVEWVPQVPVVAPPKCCVITKITITNNFQHPAYYVFNGRYQAGKAPPRSEWLKPGESRTFTGNFGGCVRIEAFQDRGYDENGDPLTGLFDDETICCDKIVSGKVKPKRFSYSINSVEWREWIDCPENPRRTPTPTATRTSTATRTPTATATPTATETPTPTATATDTPSPSMTPTPVSVTPPPIIPVTPPETTECPQRGLGCAALIVDFLELNSIHCSLKKLEKPLEDMGCDVDSVYPDFWEVPHTDFISVSGPNGTQILPAAKGSELEAIHIAVNHNKIQWRNIEVTIGSHRRKLKDGRELAIELVNAHGSKGFEDTVRKSIFNPAGEPVPGNCGSWTWGATSGGPVTGLDIGSWGVDLSSDMDDTELSRQKFIRNNYAVTNKKVCDWFIFDGSCYSGKTPMVFDQIENTGAASCSRKEVISCPVHAGWEFDVAGGISFAEVTGHNGDVCSMASDLKDVFNNTAKARDRWTADGSQYSYGGLMQVLSDLMDTKSKTWITPGSFYSDKGYHDDRPPPAHHPNRGYR